MSVYNSWNDFYKTPFGAVTSGEEVHFCLRVPKEKHCTLPRLCITKLGEDEIRLPFSPCGEEGDDALFCLCYPAGSIGVYTYYFDLYVDFTKVFCGSLGEGIYGWEQGTPYQLTVYDPTFTTPTALRGGVIYQIFPDRFCEGHHNKIMPFADRFSRPDKDGEPFFWPTEERDGLLNMDYYGGDFLGIEQKLPYLSGLGVTCIYLNPIFEAHSNHRYNTADYLKPDPLLGTIEEFRHLCRIAKNEGISIILDGVFSHTGSDSVYFDKEGRYGSDGAYHNPHSPYRPWYDFNSKFPCGYRSWWGFESLPEVNEHAPSYRNFICGEGGVIDYWLSEGASGFRLDVADELPDDFIEDIRSAIKRHGEDTYLLGEVWEDATNKESYGTLRRYLLGNGLDAVMNYPFKDAVLQFLRSGNAALLAES
ncbi:MAG: alpha-amylase family glycosyl hydrolase, partial [Pygmaiobacter sp.]